MSSLVIIETLYIGLIKIIVRPLEHFAQLLPSGTKTPTSIRLSKLHSAKEEPWDPYALKKLLTEWLSLLEDISLEHKTDQRRKKIGGKSKEKPSTQELDEGNRFK